MKPSLEQFANDLLPIAEENARDPEFIRRLREWDMKHFLLDGNEFDVDDLFGIHLFLFETEPGDFPITTESVVHTRHQTNRYLAGELKWNSSMVTTYLLPELLVHSHQLNICHSCEGFLNYCITRNHGIIFECDSCSAHFPLSAQQFGVLDRFDKRENVFTIRPATLKELQTANILPNAE